jgi:hypothetical protein
LKSATTSRTNQYFRTPNCLGTLLYYRKFIKDFSKHAKPIIQPFIQTFRCLCYLHCLACVSACRVHVTTLRLYNVTLSSFLHFNRFNIQVICRFYDFTLPQKILYTNRYKIHLIINLFFLFDYKIDLTGTFASKLKWL